MLQLMVYVFTCSSYIFAENLVAHIINVNYELRCVSGDEKKSQVFWFQFYCRLHFVCCTYTFRTRIASSVWWKAAQRTDHIPQIIPTYTLTNKLMHYKCRVSNDNGSETKDWRTTLYFMKSLGKNMFPRLHQ